MGAARSLIPVRANPKRNTRLRWVCEINRMVFALGWGAFPPGGTTPIEIKAVFARRRVSLLDAQGNIHAGLFQVTVWMCFLYTVPRTLIENSEAIGMILSLHQIDDRENCKFDPLILAWSHPNRRNAFNLWLNGPRTVAVIVKEKRLRLRTMKVQPGLRFDHRCTGG